MKTNRWPLRHGLRALLFGAAVAAGVFAAPAALAQSQLLILDEGSFSLLRDGERIGREDFGIRATRGGVGGAFIAQGNILFGEQRRAVMLNVDSLGNPLRVQLELRNEGVLVQSVVGELDRGVWSGRVAHRVGESARAFRLPMDTFVAEEGLVHHLWFVVRFGEGRPVTLFTPSVLSQIRVLVQEEAPDRVALGLREIVARRWSLRSASSGTLLYEVWTNASGRLLRVIDHGTGIEALRDEPPAETRPPLRS
ncbi:MAG: hypothetical protein KF709_12185 [Gemmatimonadaceae bacterium]|nr:hypothetical protein [Gemmatimonadaceae bacterium]